MVYRIYVEKKPGFDVEARHLYEELTGLLGIKGLTGVRILNRYDAEGLSEELFEGCIPTVFSEPPVDVTYTALPETYGPVFGVEYLPGQFDQRADSASECIQLISQGERPTVRSARIYILEGCIAEEDLAAVKSYVINPVEAREARLELPETLQLVHDTPAAVATLTGFIGLDEEGLSGFIKEYGLAMDLADITFCQNYFKSEQRDPTITEIRMIDTYWSDHCRHTTFGTILDEAEFEDDLVKAAFDRYLALRKELGREEKPRCLMDLATIGAKALKKRGILRNLDESDEINACTVKIKCDVDGEKQDWLFLFKNETHNHPTEIEPFGGAATCIGGAIRDPLSGRSYVYQAMRVTGAGDPLLPVSETLKGKLPQRKLVTTAAAGYSSYGNQIGLATGQVDELYHPGYVAKRMEIGAVVGAAPRSNVRRECPAPGDVIVLLGGRTGRDGIGGATGSSKAHKLESLTTCGAEVQKGNAPIERKLQRLFRRSDACRLIKRCNDFGAGGVSVAIGELADGLFIDLDKVPKKYDGLDGTELAISESQERMAVALAPEDVEEFLSYARQENLEATPVATVTEEKRLRMTWKGNIICDVSREFLNSNGAEKHARVKVTKGEIWTPSFPGETIEEKLASLVSDLNVCSKKGLSERFDSTIGAATVLMPFGGTYQLTPAMAMVAKLPVPGETTTVSGMAWGYNPYLMEQSPYLGAYTSVVESLAKLVCAGFSHKDAYLTFQEYFERLDRDPERWGKPAAALLGALDAQMDLGVGAIGGKDSMSGSFESLHVPPTLVSFAAAIGQIDRIHSPELRHTGHSLVWLRPAYKDGLPVKESLLKVFEDAESLMAAGKVYAAATVGYGCLAEALFKMCLGNRLGLSFNPAYPTEDRLFTPAYGSILLEMDCAAGADFCNFEGYPFGQDTNCSEVLLRSAPQVNAMGAAPAVPYAREAIALVLPSYQWILGSSVIDLAPLQELWEAKLEPVLPYRQSGERVKKITAPISHPTAAPVTGQGTPRTSSPSPAVKLAKPRVIIPVFPGTNCEYDTEKAFRRAGAETQVLVINNLTPSAVQESCEALTKAIRQSQIVMIPGGFSGGDEPDGSAKFIASFFRSPAVTDAVHDLLKNRDGLMLGICNGFQALIKLGLVPYGEIRPITDADPTLTFNTIGRHQSMLVRTRVANTGSPWLSACDPNKDYLVAISHGEGRFVAPNAVLTDLIKNGQVATQYVDLSGEPTMDRSFNPNGSVLAIEGITDPSGRVLGKMGHTERAGLDLYKNVPGDFNMPLFESGVKYFL